MLVWKLITALVHLLALVMLCIVLVPVAVTGWVVVTVSGRLPAAIHAFAGVLSWWARLAADVLSLTDEFPPYSLRTAPRPARPAAYAVSAGIGLVPAIAIVTFAVFIVGFSGIHVVIDVPYQQLRSGELPGRGRDRTGRARPDGSGRRHRPRRRRTRPPRSGTGEPVRRLRQLHTELAGRHRDRSRQPQLRAFTVEAATRSVTRQNIEPWAPIIPAHDHQRPRVRLIAEVDGNRTRRTGVARPSRFEGGGAHQVP